MEEQTKNFDMSIQHKHLKLSTIVIHSEHELFDEL